MRANKIDIHANGCNNGTNKLKEEIEDLQLFGHGKKKNLFEYQIFCKRDRNA